MRLPSFPKGLVRSLTFVSLALVGCGAERGDESFVPLRLERRTFVEEVRAAGVVEPSDRNPFFVPNTGTVVEIVENGSTVARGDLVARLDSWEIEAQRQRQIDAKALLEKDRELNRLKDLLKADEIENKLETARARLALARAALLQLEKGVDAAELVRLEKLIENTRRRLERLDEEIAQQTPAVAGGFVSREDVEDLELDRRSKTVELRTTEIDRTLVLRGAPLDRLADSRLNVALARIAVKRAAIQLDRFRAIKGVQLGRFDLRIADHQKEIDRLDELIASMTFRSPVDGVVILGERQTMQGSETIRQGSLLWPGTKVCEVCRPGALMVNMVLHECQATPLSTGLAVVMRPIARPDLLLAGRIVDVSRVAVFEEWDLYRSKWVTVKAETAAHPSLRLGTTVLCDVELGRREALILPQAAVREGQVTFVDGRIVRPKFGTSSFHGVEVLEGLAVGDELRLPRTSAFPPGEPRRRHVARIAPLSVTIKASGELRPKTAESLRITRISERSLKIEMIVDDGTEIEKDGELARLESQTLRNSLREKDLAYRTAEKSLQLALQQGGLEKDRLTMALELAVLDREIAILSEEILLLGDGPRTIKGRELDLKMVEKRVDAIRRELEVKEEMTRRGYASDKEVKDLQQRLDDVVTNFEVARVRLELARQGPTNLERAKARLEVRKAELAESLARKKLDHLERSQNAEVARSRLALVTARRERKRCEDMVAATVIRAPMAGVAVALKRWTNSGQAAFKIGDSVDRGQAFVRVSDVSNFSVKAWLPEELFDRVRPGQAVSFYLPAFPDDRYRGKVVKVDEAAVDRRIQRGVTRRMFGVEVGTEATSLRFQPGMNVQVEVVTARFDALPTLPLSALFVDEVGPYVDGSDGRRRRVAVAGYDDERVALNEGLQAGEEVFGGVVAAGH